MYIYVYMYIHIHINIDTYIYVCFIHTTNRTQVLDRIGWQRPNRYLDTYVTFRKLTTNVDFFAENDL